MAMKTKVAVLFGGHSVEHEVSIISGIQAFCALDRDKYEPVPLYISKDNGFYTGEGMGDIAFYKRLPASLSEATRVLPVKTEHGVDLVRYPMKKFGSNVVASFEVALPVVHGTNVEDGTLMGYLEMLGVPYASCDVTSSAVGMDKYLMKAALRQAGLPVLDAVQLDGRIYTADAEAVMDDIEKTVGYPVIVKPVNLGSSIGISKAADRDRLASALDLAFEYAPRVLVEKAIEPLREINCAVLGDREEAEASACEEPFSDKEILDFNKKYMGQNTKSGGSDGMAGLSRRCPADIPDALRDEVQRLAVAAFKALDCLGVSRVDFLYDEPAGKVWINEINTIPGSLAFYLWEENGVPFDRLLDRMIKLAFKRQRRRAALTFSYDTNLLASVNLGGAKGAKGAKG